MKLQLMKNSQTLSIINDEKNIGMRNEPMKLIQVDAFTTKPFTGNPAGVCILSETIPYSDMLKIAKELNLPETAFLYKNDMGYNLRWFTPNPKQK
ncbi:hypothetical protein C4E24_07950 [ANME-1 cluster archaeon AG-394-G21]|nr:hypothetical protein [ANME-1 cluster archaeon AG-394-G21]